MSFVNKRALITGASSGIGKATALAFAKAGIDVALVSRSFDKLMVVKTAIAQTGVKANAYPLDLAQVEQVQAGISKIVADFGGIDILVNNAGMGYTGALRETSLSDWMAVMNLNLTSAFQCTLAVLPSMREQQSGTVINVASIAGQQAFSDWGAYCVSKAGLIALSKTLAAEERPWGIRVTALCPGAVNTELWDTPTVHLNFDRKAMLTPENVAQAALYIALLPKQAVIEELTLMPSAGVL